VVVIWIVLAAVLVAVELHHLALFAIFGAAGAVVAAVTAVVAPHAIGIQILAAIAVTALGLVAVRPYVSTAFAHRQDGLPVARGVHGGLVGARGMTIDDVPRLEPGHVRLFGETWLAVAVGDRTIAAETPVTVVSVRGTTLAVTITPESELP
jgi:membrane protein implicated in regulation of membrane protease activity